WPVHQPSGRSSPKAAGNKLPDARHGPHIGASAQQKALFRLSLVFQSRAHITRHAEQLLSISSSFHLFVFAVDFGQPTGDSL
ncbi:hypothetical protein, partial [Roseovarius sp. A46]|uniref:hypothetical protein n=1 Tax=Roseovarius sp. A46 TaxID=2109331 RepID=UPI0019D6E741